MAGRGLLETGKLYIHAVRRAGRDGLSMRLRLFGMLLLFLNAILMGFLLILFLTGTFHSGMQATRELLENELSYRAQNVYRSFGDISVQGVTLAGELSQSLERHLAERGAVPAGLGEDTALLEELLGEELARLSGALEKARSSGVFLILDATVNPELEDGIRRIGWGVLHRADGAGGGMPGFAHLTAVPLEPQHLPARQRRAGHAAVRAPAGL